MKTLVAIVLLGILSFSTNRYENNDIILEEYKLNMTNLDYELELEAVDFEYSNSLFLQSANYECVCYKENDIKLEYIGLQVPNYKYLEELESVEFSI